MRFHLSRVRGPKNPPPPTPALAASRYATWCNAEDVIAGPFAGQPLSPHELAIATAWVREQASCGISLAVLHDDMATPRALAIAGAPGHCPDFIVYPVDGGYQTDEPFDSTWSASLLASLCSIRPMSGGAPTLPPARSTRGRTTPEAAQTPQRPAA